MKIEIEIPDSAIECAAEKSHRDLLNLMADSMARAIYPHLQEIVLKINDMDVEKLFFNIEASVADLDTRTIVTTLAYCGIDGQNPRIVRRSRPDQKNEDIIKTIEIQPTE